MAQNNIPHPLSPEELERLKHLANMQAEEVEVPESELIDDSDLVDDPAVSAPTPSMFIGKLLPRRSLSAGVLVLLQRTGNPLLTGDAAELDNAAAFSAALEIMFTLCSTLSDMELVRLSNNPAAYRDMAMEWGMSLNLSGVMAFVQEYLPAELAKLNKSMELFAPGGGAGDNGKKKSKATG